MSIVFREALRLVQWRRGLLVSSAIVAMISPIIARAQSGPFLYVPLSTTVSVFDTSNNSLSSSFPVVPNPLFAAVNGDESVVYVANSTTNTVTPFNTATNAAGIPIPVGVNPSGLVVSPDGRTVYVANSSSNSVTPIDVATNTAGPAISIGSNPLGVAVSPDGKAIYVANQGNNTITVIDTATNTVTATIPVGSGPTAIVVTPDGKTAYVVNASSGTVTPVDTASNTAAAPIVVGTNPLGIAVTPDGKTIYVGNFISGTVTPIDVATNTAGVPIAVGAGAYGVSVAADGKTLYVGNFNNGTVTPINIATNTLGAPIAVGPGPQFIGGCSNGNALLGAGLTFVARTSGALACTLSSGPTGSAGPVFTGGTLQFAGAGLSSALAISLQAAGGTLDTNGNSATLSGPITGTGGLTKTGTGTLTLSGSGTYAGATLVNAGTLQAGAINAFSPFSAFSVAAGSALDLNNFDQTIGSLAGAGNVTLGSATLTAGGNNSSTAFSGPITGTGGLTKTGTGNLNLTAANTFSGPTIVNGGILSVNGSTASSALSTVNSGGTLGGTGIVGNTIINGGTLAPGNSIGTLAVQGNLTMTAAATYMVEVSPANADRTNVAGIAALGGATVRASFAPGAYVAKRYTIVNAIGGLGGSTFGDLVTENLPSGFTSGLSYDANDAYLNLALSFIVPKGLNVNQQQVANALTNFFNAAGGIPAVFGSLTPTGLTQASGETATGTQQTTFNAMNLFMGVMTDPLLAGRGDTATVPSAEASGSAENRQASNAFAAMARKAPIAETFAQRWSVWAAGYGGSQTSDGNAAVGSNIVTSRVYGTAAGADYRISPFTLAGFALAGGGTNFGVNGSGSGRSDLFQAGAFMRHTVGPVYISSAVAYGWQDITTDRTVTIAGVDQLRARLNANAYSGRVEAGYRVISPSLGMGISPYAAGQFTTFDLPAYAEQAVSGASTFALGYASKGVTDARSELGVRTDKSYALNSSVLTLRGRAAWIHDFNPDRSISATLQALPGASFVVAGAGQSRDAALTTASAELKWLNGFSVAATFEGEFSDTTRSYAGKGVAKFQW